MISQFAATHKPVVDVTAEAIDKFDYMPESGPVGPSAFVTIMEGCSNKCTYCIVPYTRGEEQSRPVQDILDECVNHISNGVKEIHLLGQNVNSYHGLNNDGSICHFSSLLYAPSVFGKNVPSLLNQRFAIPVWLMETSRMIFIPFL